VLPSTATLPQAQAEIDATRAILAPGQPADEVLTARRPLLDLIKSGDFGVLHFACHNRFEPDDGASITFDQGLFRPTDLVDARTDMTLASSAPVVFINTCRSAGAATRYSQLDSWALGFLEAGAAVFIGSMWAVEDTRARAFATELYTGLQRGDSLGEVVVAARKAAASGDGDPTWLAYTVYGDAGARKAV
jgi:CHAT domain-containing protein